MRGRICGISHSSALKEEKNRIILHPLSAILLTKCRLEPIPDPIKCVFHSPRHLLPEKRPTNDPSFQVKRTDACRIVLQCRGSCMPVASCAWSKFEHPVSNLLGPLICTKVFQGLRFHCHGEIGFRQLDVVASLMLLQNPKNCNRLHRSYGTNNRPFPRVDPRSKPRPKLRVRLAPRVPWP